MSEMMDESNLIPAMIVAFAITAAFMLALRPVAHSMGLIDRPGGHKSHDGEIPIIGGLAMFIGLFAGMTLLQGPSISLGSLFVASLLIISIGALDDRFGLSATVRFVTQIAAVLVMVFGAGLQLQDIGDPFGTGTIGLGPLSLVITVLVTLTVINAYNLIDGADGLAGSMALVALLAIAVVGGHAGASTGIALTVAASIAAFLLFNFPTVFNSSVRSFMGDAGSTLLGFTIVWVTLGVCQGSERLISPVYCLWFAALPIFDCLTCFVRRALARKSPFAPGRDHFHHTLQRGGFGIRQTLSILTGLQLLYTLAALGAWFGNVPEFVMFAAWSGVGLSQRFIIKFVARRHRDYLRHRQQGRAA